MNIIEFKAIEPLKSNRFLINIIGTNIPSFLFRKYKLFNDGDDLIFTTEFYETVEFTFNPNEFFNITDITIDYLSPTGEIVNSLLFSVNGSNFEREQSYSDDNLQINIMRFVINKKTMKLKYENK